MHRSTVIRVIGKYDATATVARAQMQRKPTALTAGALAVIQARMEEDNENTSSDIQQLFLDYGCERISRRSVSRGMQKLGWRYRFTQHCQAIRPKNVAIRLEWCRMKFAEMQNGYNFDDLIFTDESKVEVVRTKNKSYQREGGQVKLKGRHKHPQSVLVWAGISRRGRTNIAIFTGKMDATFFCQVLDESLVPFANRIYGRNQWTLFQDNDPKHTSLKARAHYAESGINWVKTPAESPDLNPIENLWAELKFNVRAKFKPSTQAELIEAIKTFWETVDAAKCNRYINHLYKVVPKVIECEGKPSGY